MKTTRLLSSLVAIAAAGSTVLAVAGPASARTKTFHDPRGDARPTIDITGGSFTNRGKFARARARVADLRWRGSFDLLVYPVDPEEGAVVLSLTAHRDHTTETTAVYEDRGVGIVPLKCPGGVHARYGAKDDVVVFRVRRSCIPGVAHHPALSFQLDAYVGNAQGRKDDKTPFRTVEHS